MPRRIRISNFFVISGPSCVGKTTVVKRLLHKYGDRLYYPLTYTSRPLREGEINGKDIVKVDLQKYTDMLLHEEFVATTEYAGHVYGTRTDDILDAIERGQKVIAIFDGKGFSDAKKASLGPVGIYIQPAHPNDLDIRLAERYPENYLEISKRLAIAAKERAFGVMHAYNYVLNSIDGRLDILQKEIEEILCLSH